MAATRGERRRRWLVRLFNHREWLATPVLTAVPPNSQRTAAPLSERLWSHFRSGCAVPADVLLKVSTASAEAIVTIPLTDPYVILGSDRRCQLRIVSPGVAPQHYALFWLSGRLYGLNLSGNAEGFSPAGLDGWWSDKRPLRLGEYQVRVEGLPGRPVSLQISGDMPEATLTCTAPEGTRTIALKKWLTRLGRHGDNDVPMNDPGVAERQAALIRTPAALWLVNLCAARPVTMSGRAVNWVPLDPGDEFTLGTMTCQVQSDWTAATQDSLSLHRSREPFPTIPLAPPTAEDERRARLAQLHESLQRLLIAPSDNPTATQQLLEEIHQLSGTAAMREP